MTIYNTAIFRSSASILAATLLVSFAALAQNPATTINVDANSNRHPISPLIYGVASGTASTLAGLNSPLNRYGGNNSSRYNWQLNADNRDFDWYFESIGDDSAVSGERGDTLIAESKAANAQPMITVPMLDWIAKLGPNRSKLASFSQAKYGTQAGNDWQWFPDAGNGVLKSTGQNITGNDPNDANVANSTSVQQGWVRHLVSRWGSAAGNGLKFYLLDNEPSIWHATHRDVHPSGATMDEVLKRMIDYASMIKSADPAAVVVGPEEWGWTGYFYSGYDQQYGAAHDWCCLPDRQAHGGTDYLPWLLDQLRQDEVATGQRLLDVFSIHYYPQGGEFGDDTSTAMQLLRNKSTRSLWDPNYTDSSWINDQVMLIPRIRNLVAAHYPALQTAITEYNWGAENHINGATTQADIYGIFGREGLDLATRWTTPDPSTPTYKAMKMYRNYDGSASTFGDTSVAATVPSPDNLSAFAAVRSADGALTLMVINKVLSGSTPVSVNLANFAAANAAQAWQLTSANKITRLSDVSLAGSNFTTSVPAQSVTLYVVAARPIVIEYVNTVDFPNSPGGHFFYSSDPAEEAVVDAGAAGAFARTGRQFNTGGTSPVCRFYGSVTPGPNSHFFTADAGECNALKAAQITPTPTTVQQWNYEGISYNTTPVSIAANGSRSCPTGTLPLYRAYNNAFPLSGPKNPWDSDHRFTPALADIAAMVSKGWRDEGVVFCTAQ